MTLDLPKPFNALPSRRSAGRQIGADPLYAVNIHFYARHLRFLGRDRSRKIRAMVDALIERESGQPTVLRDDPWGLGLSGPMLRALAAFAEHGRLYRWATTFGAAPTGLQFQHRTVIALIDCGIVMMKTNYAVLTPVGRLLAAQQKRSHP